MIMNIKTLILPIILLFSCACWPTKPKAEGKKEQTHQANQQGNISYNDQDNGKPAPKVPEEIYDDELNLQNPDNSELELEFTGIVTETDKSQT